MTQQHIEVQYNTNKGSALPSTFISSSCYGISSRWCQSVLTFISFKFFNFHQFQFHVQFTSCQFYFIYNIIYNYTCIIYFHIHVVEFHVLWCLCFFFPWQVDVSRGSKEGSRREASGSGTRTCWGDLKNSGKKVPSSKNPLPIGSYGIFTTNFDIKINSNVGTLLGKGNVLGCQCSLSPWQQLWTPGDGEDFEGSCFLIECHRLLNPRDPITL